MAGKKGKNEDGEDDDGLWEEAMRGVRPLKEKKIKEKLPEIKKTPVAPKTRSNSLPPAPKKAMGKEIDRRTDERLRRGQMEIEGKIDLHGLGRMEAYARLVSFLKSAQTQGKRCVLVITGKGKEGAGILKSSVPEWLAESPLNELVLKSYKAKPQHGGDGALYILLRRNR